VWTYETTVEGVRYADGGADTVELLPGARRDVVLTLGRRALTAGVVVDPEGRPVSDMHLECVTHGGRERRIVRNALVPFTTVSQADGRFGFALPNGASWDVVCWSEAKQHSVGGPSVVGETCDVSSGRQDVVVVVRPAAATGALDVRAVTSTGDAVSGVKIRVVPAQSFSARILAESTTDDDGRAWFQDLPGGVVVVRATADATPAPSNSAGWVAPALPQLARLDAAPVVLVFAAGRPLRGRVEFPAGFPASKRCVAVGAFDEGDPISSGRCDDDGAFSVLVPTAARGPFRIVVKVPENSGEGQSGFQGEADQVRPGQEDIVVRVTKLR
jgi:hypothetical protein